MRITNVSTHFYDAVNCGKSYVFNTTFYLATLYWKVLLTRKLLTLTIGLRYPWPKWRAVKVDQLPYFHKLADGITPGESLPNALRQRHNAETSGYTRAYGSRLVLGR